MSRRNVDNCFYEEDHWEEDNSGLPDVNVSSVSFFISSIPINILLIYEVNLHLKSNYYK